MEVKDLDSTPHNKLLFSFNLITDLQGGLEHYAKQLFLIVIYLLKRTSLTCTSPRSSTTASRGSLPKTVPFDTVASSIGRSSVMTAAIATSNFEAMRQSCFDDFHQPVRLAKVPESAAAIERALDAGACAAWLSGSGPTVAAFVESHAAQQTMQALPDSGHTKLLKVSQYGVQVS